MYKLTLTMSKSASIIKWLNKSSYCPMCGNAIKARHVCIRCGRIGFSDNDFICKIFDTTPLQSKAIINIASHTPTILNNEIMILCCGIILKRINEEDIVTIAEANKFNNNMAVGWAMDIAHITNQTKIKTEQLIDEKIVAEIEQHKSTTTTEQVYTECILRFIESGMHKRAAELASLKSRTTEEERELVEITKSFMFGA